MYCRLDADVPHRQRELRKCPKRVLSMQVSSFLLHCRFDIRFFSFRRAVCGQRQSRCSIREDISFHQDVVVGDAGNATLARASLRLADIPVL